MMLAYRYMVGNGVPIACETSLAYYRRVADLVEESIDPADGVEVERIRLNDDTSRKSASEEDVIQYYQLNAERGDVKAQLVVGQVLYKGLHGQRQNLQEAFRFLSAAATAGDPTATALLGEMYYLGRGVTKNYEMARKYFEVSILKKNPYGYNGLGKLYLEGHGVPVNPEKAFDCFKTAATSGLADAQYYLGVLYYGGVGTKR